LQTMTISNRTASGAGPRRQLILVFLLFLVATINYFDRQSLSVVAPRLQAELHIDDQGYAHIVGLFLLASAFAYAVAGFITDWIGTRRAMALFVGWWSLAEASTMLATNTLSLGLARFCLGLGEPGLWVAAPKAVGEVVAERRRALAIGIYSMGGSVGAVVALPAIALLTSRFPWRSVFLIDGAAGLLWLPLWFWATRAPRPIDGTSPQAGLENSRISPENVLLNLRAVVTRASTWKLVAARGFTDPVWYFYLFWFPKYLVSSRHMTLGGLAHFAWFVSCLSGFHPQPQPVGCCHSPE